MILGFIWQSRLKSRRCALNIQRACKVADTTSDIHDVLDWVKFGPSPAIIPQSLIDRLSKIEDLSSTVSDVLDELGLVGAVCASTLRPTLAAGRVVGRAITVRNQEQRVTPLANATQRRWQMAEIGAISSAAPGDVLIIEGVADVSNMGGIISTTAKRQGISGAIVDGGVRDVAHSRRIGFPIWSRHISPVTGKWRCVTQEINGPVTIGGVAVAAGDLVIADETGICFVPADKISQVIDRCEEIAAYEDKLDREIAGGVPMADLIEQLYGGQHQ
jgi:4-hydroxy-4-methyl-2-oxoglutarate aldolase